MKKLHLNALANLGQTTVSIVLMFVLYKYLILTIGVKKFGVWSLILSTTTVVSLGNFGISTSIVKFVAQYYGLNDFKKINAIIATSLQTIITSLAIISVIAFFAISYYLPSIISEVELLSIAQMLLPYSIFTFFVNCVSGIFQSSLDGIGKIYIKAFILIFFNVVYFVTSIIAVKYFELIGLAYVQLFQSILLLMVNYYYLSKFIVIPFKSLFFFDKASFKEIIGYGVNFQVMSLTQILTDPVTKSLIAKFGGIGLSAYYELASKVVISFRLLILSSNNVIIPEISKLNSQSNKVALKELIVDNYKGIIFLCILIFPICFGLSVIVSRVWLEKIDMEFIHCYALVCIGFMINTLSLPIYFLSLGTGNLKFNVLSNIVASSIIILLGLILGFLFGGILVIYSWVIGVVAGLLIICVPHFKQIDLKIMEIFDMPIVIKFLSSILFAALLFYSSILLKNCTVILNFLILGILILAYSFLYLKNSIYYYKILTYLKKTV